MARARVRTDEAMKTFSDFDPAPRRLARTTARARSATDDDLPAAAALSQRRSGGELDGILAGMRELIESGREAMLVAEVEGAVQAFAKWGTIEPPPDAPENSIPAGWYLTGVVVAPEHRRRGIALELTRARVDLIHERAESAYYFANERNRASIALHERLGFREVRRGIWAPGVTFDDGVGVLFGLARP